MSRLGVGNNQHKGRNVITETDRCRAIIMVAVVVAAAVVAVAADAEA